jgi:predicted RNase H-like nuclease (RuvC/YqgF family)
MTMNGSSSRGLLVVLVVTTLGLWGCSQNRGGTGATKVRDLEARNTKLEEDYQRAAAEAVDVRKKLTTVEAQSARWARQVTELQKVVQERDRLRRQLTTSQTERNALQAQMQQFSRDLQARMGKVDAAVGNTVTQSGGGTGGSL